MPRAYHHYAGGQCIYFNTSTVVNRIPIFLSHRYFKILIDALSYCRNEQGLPVHAYVLMPNHFHAIVSSEPHSALPGIIRDLKRHTAWEIARYPAEEGSWYILRQLEWAAGKAG